MLDLISNRAVNEIDLVNAEGALLTVYQQLEEKKHEAQVLKSALHEEQRARKRAEHKNDERQIEVQNLTEKYKAIQVRLTETRHRLRSSNGDTTEQQRIVLKEQEDRIIRRQREVEEKCRRSDQLISQERQRRIAAEEQVLELKKSAEDKKTKLSKKENLMVDADDLLAQSSALSIQVKLYKDEMDARDSKIQALERKCRRLEERGKQAEAEKDESEGYVKGLEDKCKALSHQVSRSQKHTEEAHYRVGEENAKFREEKGEMERTIRQLKAQNEELKIEIELLQKKCLKFEEKLDSQTSSDGVQKLRDKNEKLFSDVMKAREDIASREQVILNLEDKCQQLETEGDYSNCDDNRISLVRHLRERNKVLSNEIAELKSELMNRYADKVVMTKEEAKILRTKTEELELSLLSAQRESKLSVENFTLRNEQLESYLSNARQTAMELKQKCVESEAELKKLSASTMDQRLDMEKVKSDNECLGVMLEQSHRRIDDLLKELRELKYAAEEEIESLTDDLHGSKNLNEQLQKEMDTMRKRIEQEQLQSISRKTKNNEASTGPSDNVREPQHLEHQTGCTLADLENDLASKIQRSQKFLNAEIERADLKRSFNSNIDSDRLHRGSHHRSRSSGHSRTAFERLPEHEVIFEKSFFPTEDLDHRASNSYKTHRAKNQHRSHSRYMDRPTSDHHRSSVSRADFVKFDQAKRPSSAMHHRRVSLISATTPATFVSDNHVRRAPPIPAHIALVQPDDDIMNDDLFTGL